MLPCFAQVVVAATMTIGAAGGTADTCFLEVIGFPADGHTVVVEAFDYAPPGTMRTIWNGGGAFQLVASPTPAVQNYLGLPSVANMQVAPLDLLVFVSIGQYVAQNQSAWQLVSVTRYQSPGEIPGASRGLSLTTDYQYHVGITAEDVVLCDEGHHCIQQRSPAVTVDFSSGLSIGGVDRELEPGRWYLYVLEAPQGPSAIASPDPTWPLLPMPTTPQNNYSWAAPVGYAVIDARGYVVSVAPLPAR